MTLKRGFFHLSESWYGEKCLSVEKYLDEIVFGLYETEEGGTTGEIAMQWHDIKNVATPKLEVYNDSLHLISTFSDVMDALSKMKQFTPQEFAELLRELGFEDKTIRQEPKTSYGFWEEGK